MWGLRLCVIGVLASTAGCQAPGGLALSNAVPGSTVKLVNGQDYPAEFVTYQHPAIASAMATNAELWGAGHHAYFSHCYYMDAKGGLNTITLYGVLFASAKDQPLVSEEAYGHTFGGAISPAQIRAAAGNDARLIQLFVDSLWKASGGNLNKALALLKQAEEHDADCNRQYLNEIRAINDVTQQSMNLTRDASGRPVVVRTIEADASGLHNKALAMASEQVKLIEMLIPIYDSIYGMLAQRAGVQVAQAPPSRASYQPEAPAPQPEVQPPASVAKKGPKPPPSALQSAELRKVDQEYVVLIKTLREKCLLKAGIECT
jgi:hypothetical protein